VSRSRFAVLSVSILAALLCAGPRPASAQCFGPDGLDLGPCCGPVVPNLPAFPAASLPALGACWDRCTQGLQQTLKISWNTPAQPACTEYTTQLLVNDGTSGLAMLTGTMVLNYTRTWTEIDPTGNAVQVWRFAAKADLSWVPGGPVPNCVFPPCLAPAGPHPTAFFYGYVDYAACNVAGGFENVLVLVHMPDRFIHQPGLSDKPGIHHPGQSYAIIAPHSALQPFLPGNAVAVGGPVLAEAMRNVNVPGIPPGVCLAEDHVQGNMTKLGAGCLANIANTPKQHTLRQFNGQAQCVNTAGVPGAWASLNINFPALPWFHMVTTSVGTWTNGNVYPGKESAWVDEGLFVHQDACTGDFFEMKYGGTTKDGWTAILNTGLTVRNFTDLADNYSAPITGPFPLPILGSVRPTEHLLYVNEP
jgi:hypothetical protein